MFNKKKNKKKVIKIKAEEFNKAILSWNANEFHNHGEIVGLKVFVIVFLLAIIVLGLIYNSWTFSLAIAAYLIVQHTIYKGKNEYVKTIISNVGIKVGKRKYAFSNIDHFWISKEKHLQDMIVIKVYNDIAGEIKIQLGEQDSEEVRKLLKTKIKELKGKKLSFMDHMSLLLRF